jgi:ribosomal protein S18 acetylase RimI-like enzyme
VVAKHRHEPGARGHQASRGDDLSKVETVARATGPVADAGIIPDEVQRRLLDSWYSRESFSRALAAQASRFFVAESSDDVIGFAQFVRRSAESVELTRIYVLPDRQRSGIGMRLLDAGLTEFAAEGLNHHRQARRRLNTWVGGHNDLPGRKPK